MAAPLHGRPRVAVVGGGWAGLAAAHHLLAAGWDVHLWEGRGEVGGRATSFRDRATGLTLDNGQHVLLGACPRALGILAEAGLEGVVDLQPALRLGVVRRGVRACLASVPALGRLHLLPSAMAHGGWTALERLSVLAGAVAVGLGVPARPGETFHDYLRRVWGARGESFWDLAVTSLLNTPAHQADAAAAARALRLALLAGPGAARLGLFRRPLGEVARRWAEYLMRRGLFLHAATWVRAVEVAPGGGVMVRAEDARGRRDSFKVQAAVLAVPPGPALRLLGPWARSPQVRAWSPLAQPSWWSPILNVYAGYEAPRMAEDVLAMGQAVVFNRGRLLREEGWEGRLMGISVSAADAWVGLGAQAAEQVAGEVEGHLDWGKRMFLRAVWQRTATLRLTPQAEALRPPPPTPLPGVVLAGDWTATGLPPSLEGAVESGQRAAQALFRQVREGEGEGWRRAAPPTPAPGP